jgi:DNA primase
MTTSSIDILSLVGVPLKRVSATRGGEYAGACPLCNAGKDRLRVQPEQGQWWCRVCGGRIEADGHISPTAWGDAIDFVRRRDNLTYSEACQALKIDQPAHPSAPIPVPPDPAEPPSDLWQEHAEAFVEQAQHNLWNRSDVGAQRTQAWLASRGLLWKTITQANIGYWPADTWEDMNPWGLETGDAIPPKRVWLPRGIVVPWWVGGHLWRVIIRRPISPAQKASGQHTYQTVNGSTNALYNADALAPACPAVICEGVFDALAVQQEAGDLIAAVACGTTGAHKVKWLAQLAACRPVLVALDNDEDPAKGEQAGSYWLDALGPIARRWRPYVDDPAAMLQAGMDLRTWVEAGLEEHTNVDT